MKAIVYDDHTRIFPTDSEVTSICCPGTADCCVWLIMTPNGWECMHHNRMPVLSLVDRFEAGLTNAKRDGCIPVKNFDPAGLEGEVEIKIQR